MAKLLNSKPQNLTLYPNSFERQGAFPIDANSLFFSLLDAENYAKTNPVAYVGQIISVIDSGKVNAFQIINEAGDLGSVSSSANFNMIEGYNASDIIKELADE